MGEDDVLREAKGMVVSAWKLCWALLGCTRAEVLEQGTTGIAGKLVGLEGRE